MCKIISFPKTFHPEDKVVTIPNFFTNLLKGYHKKQDDLRKRKICALYNALFEYFLTIENSDDSVCIPAAIIAQEKACKEIMRVIKEKTVNKYYTLLKKAEKRAIRG